MGTRELGERILRTVAEAGGIFVPEVFDVGGRPQGRWVRFDPDDLGLPLKGWTDDRYSLGIIGRRLKPLKVFLHVSASDFMMFDFVSLTVCLDKSGLEDSRRIKKLVDEVGFDRLLEVSRKLYAVVEPNWGYVQNDFYEHLIGTIFDSQGRHVGYDAPKGPARKALHGLFWANFFGPEYVEMFGREKLLSAPCHRVEELPDGGILLILSESPLDVSTPKYIGKKEQLYNYLGKDAFTGAQLPKFRVGEGRKTRDARPLMETGGVRDDVFH